MYSTLVVPLCDMRYLEHQVRMSHEENYKGMFTTTLTHSFTYSTQDGEVRELVPKWIVQIPLVPLGGTILYQVPCSRTSYVVGEASACLLERSTTRR
jgi:hypothetical protein